MKLQGLSRVVATRTWISCLLLLVARAGPLHAHTSLPGYLDIKETTPGNFDFSWRVPIAEGPPPAIYPIFPEGCKVSESLRTEQAPASIIRRGSLQCGAQGLVSAPIEISGLNVTILDVLLRVTFADGTTVSHMLKPLNPQWTVTRESGPIDRWGYLGLGVAHILYGIDHLLFVLGLLLIVHGTSRLLKTITAFTVAHTITLALAVLKVIRISSTPVEAVIALSIVFLAVELVQQQRKQPSLTSERPWIVAFAFGLLHGFGFAGTLSRIGIPYSEIPAALLFFNLGVEAGQIAFVAVFLAFIHSLRTLEIRWPAWVRPVPAYAIGSVASFWLVQRCAMIF
jgi:hydrogenase/urease accessory protein HupE